jgi:hypothetical protein
MYSLCGPSRPAGPGLPGPRRISTPTPYVDQVPDSRPKTTVVLRRFDQKRRSSRTVIERVSHDQHRLPFVSIPSGAGAP